MNRLSHIMFAFSLFVGLYSLIFAFTVWQSDLGQLNQFLIFYLVGGVAFMLLLTPLLYWKAPNKESASRTTSNRGAASAVAFMVFAIGSLAGSMLYLWYNAIPFIGRQLFRKFIDFHTEFNRTVIDRKFPKILHSFSFLLTYNLPLITYYFYWG